VRGERQPPRWMVREVACPTCGAAAGQACQRLDGSQRTRHHMARVTVVQGPRDFPAVASTGAVTAEQIRRAGAGARSPLAG
jgi:hypothetical protein